MDQSLKKELSQDPDGLLTYEYIANHIGTCDDIMPELIDNMILVDKTGQFVTSAARYLNAIDAAAYAQAISKLVNAAIEKDRDRLYLANLVESLYGDDYVSRAEELSETDDNFRRIYKRLIPPKSL
ncbi:MAG: hypothetical protein NC339_00405 [Muribaculaceae bacterium]|nr:hypothetical protein [Muribaculaceae bacterium]